MPVQLRTKSSRVASICAVVSVVSGCEHYTRADLPASALPATSVARLDHANAGNVAGPLSVTQVAALAVANSPDLRAARSQHGVSEAQVFLAGILPNPTVTGSLLPLAAGPAGAGPTANGPGGSSTLAWNVGLSYDVRSLVTRTTRRASAVAAAHALDASLLWQEWQTVGQARLLAVDLIEGDRLLALLDKARALSSNRAAATRAALSRNDATLATAAPDFAAEQTARGAYDDQQRTQSSRRHQLAALLGLAPDAPLALVATPDLPSLDERQIADALASLPDRRPDLAALRFGYQAQDAKLRTAILSQFPNLTFGVTGGSDNSNIRNVGPQIGLEIPLFDRNQGQIALERATRAQLRAEYAARLTAAYGQVRSMSLEIAELRRQISEQSRDLPELQRNADAAARARDAGNLDERSALDLIGAYLAKRQSLAVLEQTLDEQIVQVSTLVGAGLPPLAVRSLQDGRT